MQFHLGPHSEFDIFGFICHLDLFPVSRPNGSPTQQQMTSQMASWPTRHPHAQLSSPSSESLSQGAASLSSSSPGFPRADGDFPMEDAFDRHDVPQTAPLSQSPVPHAVANGPMDAPFTQYLAGEAFISCSLVEYEGSKAAMFVFSVRCHHHPPSACLALTPMTDRISP